MSTHMIPDLTLEKISLDRLDDFYDALNESGKEWFAAGMIPKPDFSREEAGQMLKGFVALWDQDNTYMFFILDAQTKDILGVVFLNRIDRTHQLANLGYVVRTSRTRRGIATEAARLVAEYGFEKLGLQRIEIVASKDNFPSLKVAEKLHAVREGLLRNRILLHGIPTDAYLHSLISFDFGISKPS